MPRREKSRLPVKDLLRPDNFQDLDEEAAEVPASVQKHWMFSTDAAPEGPSTEDLEDLCLAEWPGLARNASPAHVIPWV